MTSRLLTLVLRRTTQPPRLAPSAARLARAPLSTTVHSGGPPGSGFTTIMTPDPTHTLPPPSLSSLHDPMPPAPIYKNAVAAAAAASSGEGGTAKHSGGHPHHPHHSHHMEMGATEKREDREELHMAKEGQRQAKKTKGGKEAGAADAGQHEKTKAEEDADMNEHARDEAAKRTQDYST